MFGEHRIPLVSFVLSLLVFVFLYGFLVGNLEWFPHSYLNQAWEQARTRARRYGFVHSDASPGFVVPEFYDRSGVRVLKPGELQPGLRLISSSWKGSDGWDPRLRLINQRGQTLHEWRIERSELFQGGIIQRYKPDEQDVHGSLLLPNGDVVVNLEYVGLARLNSCGDVLWTLEEGNHHSIAQADDGTFWVPGVSQKPEAGSKRFQDGYPGLGGKRVWRDRIMRVSGDGRILNDINVLDVLYANGLDRYIPKYHGGPWPTASQIHPDVTHLNDVEPLSSSMSKEYPLFEQGDLLVSLRNLNLVFVMDPESLQVRWHVTDPFIHQHDPDFLGNGWIGIFDNNEDFTVRGSMLGGSRIVALQPHTRSKKILFPTQHSDPFYTGTQGKWQMLDNGNLLLSESSRSRVVEVNPRGESVWEWVHKPTDDAEVAVVAKARLHDLSVEEVASWPCSSVDPSKTPGDPP